MNKTLALALFCVALSLSIGFCGGFLVGESCTSASKHQADKDQAKRHKEIAKELEKKQDDLVKQSKTLTTDELKRRLLEDAK